MKYYEAIFTITPCTDDACDILAALVADAGFDSFENTATGLKAYAIQQFFDESALTAALATFPIPDTQVGYTVTEAEDRDWNEQWEQEGFEPIVIGNLVIHDGRHLPAEQHSDLSLPARRLLIEIDARLAFGTGTHETTRMICRQLLSMSLEGKRVLDAGCGTGILGICALKLGAAACVAYDIDEWSVDNTRHNSVINGVDDRLTPLLGDSSVLGSLADTFDIVLANINRNILLQDMPHFAARMHAGSYLVLSGFYRDDCKMLEEKAAKYGLTLRLTDSDGLWQMLLFQLSCGDRD